MHNDFEYIHFFDKHALHSVVCEKCLSLVFYLILFFFTFLLERLVLVGSE